MKTKIINKLAFLVLLSYAVIFNSCDFVSTTNLTKKSYETQIQTVIPQQYKPTSDKSERSATPAFSSLVYNITATCTDENTVNTPKTKTFTSSELTNNISLPLETGNWSIVVTVYDSSDLQKTTVFAGSATLLVTEYVQTDPLIINLEVYKDNNGDVVEGNGSISVDVNWSTSKISKYTYKLTGNGYSDTLHSSSFNTYAEGGNFTISYSDIPAKSDPYLLTVLFYNSDNLLIYSLQSSISVFANLVSNTWRNELELDTTEGSPTEGEILITDEHLEAYKTKYIYVRNVETGEPFGVGSYYSPYAVLQDAINKVLSLNDGTSTYYIFVDGTICENSTLTLTSGEINLVIRGYNNALLDCSESPYSSVISFEGDGTKNIELNGITINSGLSSGNGGGINTEHTNLTLRNCTIGINECDANYNGGGIYVSSDSTLTLKGTNQIIDNEKTDGHIASNVYLCSGATINIDGNISGSNIGVTIADEPTEQNLTRVITTGFNGSSTNLPAACFTSDQGYQIGMVGTEAACVMNKGTITPVVSENVRFSLGIKAFAETDTTEDITVTPKAYINGNEISSDDGFSWINPEIYNSTGDNITSNFTISQENGKLEITFDKKDYSAGENITFFMKAQYNGIIYSTSACKIKVLQGLKPEDVSTYLQSLPAGQTAELFISEKNPDLSSIKTSISSYGGSISLDLSSCTELTTISESAFLNCSNLKEIELPDSVTTIKKNAFKGCTGLTSIELPDSVTTIESYVFRGCTGLTSMEIPSSVSKLGNGAFQNCSSIKTIKFGENSQMTSLSNDFQFEKCTALEELYLPDNLKYWRPVSSSGESTIPSDLPKLKKIVLSVKNISVGGFDWHFFNMPPNLEELEIINDSDNKYSIEDGFLIRDCTDFLQVLCAPLVSGAVDMSLDDKYKTYRYYGNTFQGNSRITSVTLPSVFLDITGKSEGILYSTFQQCNNLTEVIIPEGIEKIRYACFKYCRNLTTISFPTSLKELYFDESHPTSSSYSGCQFMYCEKLQTVDLSNTQITNIPYECFLGCSALNNISCPESLESIGSSSFYNCTSLESFTVKNAVTEIQSSALYGCTNLNDLIFEDISHTWKEQSGSTVITEEMDVSDSNANAQKFKKSSNKFYKNE